MTPFARKKRGRLRAFFLRPRTLLCLVLAALVLAAVIVDGCVFPLRHAAAFASVPALSARAEGELRVHFVDVGQGDCTILEFPDGKTMAIDGGDGSLRANAAAVGYCLALGITRFDCVLLTHTDADHAAGLAELLSCFGADTVLYPAACEETGEETGAADGEAYARFLAEAEACGAKLIPARAYAHLLSEREELFYYLLMLAPLSRGEYKDANDASAVCWLEYAGNSVLFTGDAPAEREEELAELFLATGGEVFSLRVPAYGREVALSPDLSKLTFLKAGHHGSNASTGDALLTLCKPEAVFFSAGAGNGYGHPSADCITRVRALVPDAQIWRTDELGSILLTLSADGSASVRAVRR